MGLPEIALDDIVDGLVKSVQYYSPGDELERLIAAYEGLGEVKAKKLVEFLEKKYERTGVDRIDEILGHLSKRIEQEVEKRDAEMQKAATRTKRKPRSKSKARAGEGESSSEQPEEKGEG